MTNYDFEIEMMEAELNETPEELDLRKERTRAERRQRTRRAKARAAEAKALKKHKISAYAADEAIREHGKDRHYFTLYPDTDIIRVTTERQLPIRIRRKGAER